MAKNLSGLSRQGKRQGARDSSIAALTTEMESDLAFLKSLPDESIDTTDPDAPDLSGRSGWVRGKFYRPIKKPISIRLEMDVLDWFKTQGEPYQVLINQVLRAHMEANSGSPATAAPDRE